MIGPTRYGPVRSPRLTLGGSRGMTLLEVVLAVTIASGVMISAMVFYRQAIEIRRRLYAEVLSLESARLVMDRITNELRAATSYKFLEMGMEGDTTEVQFVTARVPRRRLWELRKGEIDQSSPEHDLQIVGYRLRTAQDKQTGNEIIIGLERTSQGILTARTTEADSNDEKTDERAHPELRKGIKYRLMSSGLHFLRFRYWRGGIWLESWTGGDLPHALEITMGTEPLGEETTAAEYQYPVFRRVVYIPGAGPPPRGTVIQGLEDGVSR